MYVDVQLGEMRRRQYLQWRDAKRHGNKWGTQLRAEGAIQALDDARQMLMDAAEWSQPVKEFTKDNGC